MLPRVVPDVPLADNVTAVSVRVEHLGQQCLIQRKTVGLGGPDDLVLQAVTDGVAAREQCRAERRAKVVHMVVLQLHTLRRERIQVGRGDFAPVEPTNQKDKQNCSGHEVDIEYPTSW